ncbi:hypothetical protein ACHAPJ_010088 [Fusarium lateritium]
MSNDYDNNNNSENEGSALPSVPTSPMPTSNNPAVSSSSGPPPSSSLPPPSPTPLSAPSPPSASDASDNEADQPDQPQAASLTPAIPPLIQVDELRWVGIVNPLGSIVAFYIMNPFGGPDTNVMAYSNLSRSAVLFQGPHREHLDGIMDMLDFGHGLATHMFPVNSMFAELDLPPGFSRYYLELRHTRLADPRFLPRPQGEGPPSLVRQSERILQDWIQQHRHLVPETRRMGIIIWPYHPDYNPSDMTVELLQEFEEDEMDL